jgi:hypothetical protein
MKRAILFGVLCLTALAVLPVAAASAETKGVCTIEGEAEFRKGAGGLEPLNVAVPSTHGYKFSASGGSCTNDKGLPVALNKAEVNGEGELACVVSNGVTSIVGKVSGSGVIEVGGEGPKTFEFKFVAAAGNVLFTATGGVTAVGDAQFLTPAGGAERAEKCVKSEITKLPFLAVTAGKIG